MTSTRLQPRRTAPQVERLAELPGQSKPHRGLRLFRALARIVGNGATHDEATFFRVEYGEQTSAALYTTARDEQLQSELLGPPPMGW